MLNVFAPSPPVPTTSTRSSRLRPDGEHVLAHRLGAARDLVGGLALEPQRDEEAADLRLRRLAAHDLVHHVARLRRARGRGRRAVARAPSGSRAQEVLPEARAPSGVSTDSGWNWTPSIGSSRWRTPITSPSRRARGDLELVRDLDARRASGSARPRGRCGSPGEDALAVVLDVRRLAVQERLRRRRPRRRRPRRSPGGRGRRRASAPSARAGGSARPRCPRPSGRPGPGEITQVRRLERLGLVDRDRVVPEDPHLRAELLEQVRRGCR